MTLFPGTESWETTTHRPPAIAWSAPGVLPDLSNAKRIAIDCETKDPTLSELGPGVALRGGHIVGLAVAVDGGPRWYFPTRHEGGGNLDEGLVKRWARDELNKFSGEVVGTRLIYDLEALTTWGVHMDSVSAFHDIQVAEPLLDEHRLRYDLDALSLDYLGVGKEHSALRGAAAAYGWKTEKEIKSNLWRLPAGYVGPYAEGDVDRPLRIFPKQHLRLEAEGLLRVYDVERKLIPILLAMRLRGVKVDVARAEEVHSQLQRRLKDIMSKLRRLAGPKAELMSPDSFAKALDDRGLKYPLTPKTQKPSIKKDWLEANAGDELVDLVIEGRKIYVTDNTFVQGHILRHAIGGRVHCEFNQLKSEDGGTIGRFSSANPNMQNVTARDEELAPMIRGMFVPEDGEEWQRDDASQIEYRLLAHFAVGVGADEARDAYRVDPKTDFHKMCAGFLGADPEDKFVRKRVKNTNFCKVYGGGIPKIAATFGCSIDEATAFVKVYEEKLPFVQKTFDRASLWAQKRGYIVTLLDRRQRFSLWEPYGNYKGRDFYKRPLPREEAVEAYGPRVTRAFAYTALNKKLQCSAADLMKKGMVDAWEAGVCQPDALGPFLLTVHDELDTSVPRTPRGDEAGRELTRIMEQTIPLRVPVIVERTRGANWGACS